MRGQPARVGATRISPNGYHYTRTIDRGWVPTARLIAEKRLNRTLRQNERVRFNDENPLNLDPDNIRVEVTKGANLKTKLARLEAKRDEIDAQIADIREQLGLQDSSFS